jgi:hypothetical protein
LNNFSGGLNNASRQPDDHEATNLLNVVFSDDTLVKRRQGIKKVEGRANTTTAITFMDRFEPYTNPVVELHASDSALYSGTTKLLDVAGRVTGTNYMGYYLFADGDKLRMYGSFPQTAGTSTYIFGTPSAANRIMELVNPPAGFTPKPNPATEGAWAYDYVNNKVWYEPCAYEVADTYKGSNVIPEKPKYVLAFKERLYVSGSSKDDDNVFISDVANGFYFPVYLPIQIPPDSDAVRGLYAFYDSVVVARGGDMHAIYGNTNRTDLNASLYRLERLNTHTGIASNRVVDIVNNYLFYLGSDGSVYAMYTTNTDTNSIMTTILSQKIDLFEAPLSNTREELADACAVYFDGDWYLRVGQNVLMYSYKHRAWTLQRFTSLQVTHLHVHDNSILYGVHSGDVFEHYDEYMDNGLPYMSTYSTKFFDVGEPATYKHLREFYIVSEVPEEFPSDVRVKFEVDYADVIAEFEFKSQISRWGYAKFGERFINRNINESAPMNIGKRCRSFRITFSASHIWTADVVNVSELDDVPNKRVGMVVRVTSNGTFYIFEPTFTWRLLEPSDLNQPMRIYEINGEYEFRRKR